MQQMLKFCGKGIAIILDAGNGCCSKELQNSKTKKTKTKFPMDKSKATKMKNKDVSQEEAAAIDRGMRHNFFSAKGDQVEDART
jgi:hypothetical protein